MLKYSILSEGDSCKFSNDVSCLQLMYDESADSNLGPFTVDARLTSIGGSVLYATGEGRVRFPRSVAQPSLTLAMFSISLLMGIFACKAPLMCVYTGLGYRLLYCFNSVIAAEVAWNSLLQRLFSLLAEISAHAGSG